LYLTPEFHYLLHIVGFNYPISALRKNAEINKKIYQKEISQE